ncbi:MFS transporter [Streptomyces alanosinicus]|uniref:MFS transporter n=1 Tax=Streptomyces alanosinicus TaxID=68171 RepID=UPI001E5464F9|nr:MFS transporter [Streptomyces alanosinicus]
MNLRAAITGLPPVLVSVTRDAHLSGAAASVLAALPVLCLGLFAGMTPLLARRAGTSRTVAAALVLIGTGCFVRILPGAVALFAGTVLAGAGIAVGNVLVPAVVKQRFPARQGAFMGVAMLVMALSGALAAALAVPLSESSGWRGALAVWSAPALLGAVVWATGGRTADEGAPVSATRRSNAGEVLRRSGTAWSVVAFLGLVCLIFYTTVAWLPQIMQARGYTPASAGAMISLLLALGIPLGMAVPVAAARMRSQRPLVLAVLAAHVTGLGGILLLPEAGWLWVCVLGIATGSGFPLAVTLLTLRSPDPETTARLSGMANTGGYLLAAAGPLAVGLLHTATGSWALPLLVLLAVAVPETCAGLIAARPVSIGVPEKKKEEVVRQLDTVG